jgi:sugar (pentulose or hexulose) kinase
MNLMDVLSHRWVDVLLESAGGRGLPRKLKEEPVEGGATLGKVHPYWTQRWGFTSGTSVLIPKFLLA